MYFVNMQGSDIKNNWISMMIIGKEKENLIDRNG